MSKPYAALSAPEKWQWHAGVYAFRRVVLGISSDEKTSPCDTDGIWYDGALVDAAEQRMRNRRSAKAQSRSGASDAIWEARDIEDKWARQRGYNNFEHYKASERLDHSEACKRLILSLPGLPMMPRAVGGRVDDPHSVAAALGVTAREYTAEELRAGRIALGLEPADETTNTAASAA